MPTPQEIIAAHAQAIASTVVRVRDGGKEAELRSAIDTDLALGIAAALDGEPVTAVIVRADDTVL